MSQWVEVQKEQRIGTSTAGTRYYALSSVPQRDMRQLLEPLSSERALRTEGPATLDGEKIIGNDVGGRDTEHLTLGYRDVITG